MLNCQKILKKKVLITDSRVDHEQMTATNCYQNPPQRVKKNAGFDQKCIFHFLESDHIISISTS